MATICFFQPTQSFTELAEILFWLGSVVILVWVAGIACSRYLQFKKQQKAWAHFRTQAERYGLSLKEINFLQRLLKKQKCITPERFLMRSDLFDQPEKPAGKWSGNRTRQYIRTIRRKLFEDICVPSSDIQDTFHLKPGAELRIRYLKQGNLEVWGRLEDVDHKGLIIVIPATQKLPLPLRPNTPLRITAYMAGQPPVCFLSLVESVIPGPKRMIVVEHSTILPPSLAEYSTTQYYHPKSPAA